MEPSFDALIARISAIYAGHGAGCCLHIVTDDGNVEADSVRYCLAQAKKRQHPECVKVANMLLALKEPQREAIYERYREYYG